MNKKPKQSELVLAYMQQFGSITQFEALRDICCMRLASRISELRKNGHSIGSEFVSAKNRYGETVHFKKYFIVKDKAV